MLLTLVDQPAPKIPTKGDAPVWEVAILLAKGHGYFRVSEAGKGRHELGIRRYGVPLSANNGRDPLVDACQKALDLVAYLVQDDLEQGGGLRLAEQAMQLAEVLLRRLEVRRIMA